MKMLIIENQKTKPEYVNEIEGHVLIEDLVYTNNPEYGMSLLNENPFDVLILELVLSGTDGFEILKTLRTKPEFHRMKIFIATHIFSDNGIQRAFQLGADHYMIKPVNSVVLTDRISEIRRTSTWLENPILPIKSPTVDTMDLDTYLPDLLKHIGTSVNIKGYRYLISALKLTITQPELFDHGITKAIYPMVAKEFATTPSRVERAIRHAIEKTWNDGPLDVLEKIFGNTIASSKGKPTNSEFISGICEYVRISKKSSPLQ